MAERVGGSIERGMVPRPPQKRTRKRPAKRRAQPAPSPLDPLRTEEPIARLLVVDDHLDARLLLEEFLQQHGFYVALAKDGEEALALLEGTGDFDLVLLDLAMPRLDGHGFLDALRRAPGGVKNTPVVVISGSGSKRVRGVSAHLQKPAPLDRVLEAVRKALPKH